MPMPNHTPPVKMPVLFVGHGSPMNAIESNAFTRALEKLDRDLPHPRAICVVSAHWVTRGSQVLAAEWPRTIHDFYGFPKPLYEVQYPAPGAPEEAKRLAFEHHLAPDQKWGLDHGAWSVLRHMYPQADVPVFQVSLDQTRTFAEHLALGHELQKMRERGILILGSGNLVHNLHKMNWELPHEAYPWATAAASRCAPCCFSGLLHDQSEGDGGKRKLFEEPVGVADGVAIKVYVPEGVMIGGGCCAELAAPPPPLPHRNRSSGTPSTRSRRRASNRTCT